MKYKIPKYRPRAWLWWIALVIGSVGGGYYYYLAERINDPSTHYEDQLYATVTLIVTGAAVTICIIAATAQLWFKR